MPKLTKTASAERLQFVKPMYARAVQQLPEGKDWLYEVKFGGYRCLASRDSSGVAGPQRRDEAKFLYQLARMSEEELMEVAKLVRS